jgi:hypothetical protein
MQGVGLVIGGLLCSCTLLDKTSNSRSTRFKFVGCCRIHRRKILSPKFLRWLLHSKKIVLLSYKDLIDLK